MSYSSCRTLMLCLCALVSSRLYAADLPTPDAVKVAPGNKEFLLNARVITPDKWQAGAGADATCSTVDLDVTNLLSLCWNSDGSKLYACEKSGILHVVRFPSFTAETRVDFGVPVAATSLSKIGLLISLRPTNDIWLFPVDTFKVSKQFSLKGIKSLAASPVSSMAVAVAKKSLTLLDLAQGKVVKQCTPEMFAEQLLKPVTHQDSLKVWEFSLGCMSPDGKYFFSTDLGCLSRFLVTPTNLTQEEVGPRIGLNQNPKRIEISGDSTRVALVCGGGNSDRMFEGIKPYTTFIYATTNLQEPASGIASGPYPLAMGFDSDQRTLYTQNHDYQIQVFDPRVRGAKEYRLSEDRGSSEDTIQILPHPSGGKVLVWTEKKLYWMVFPAPAAPAK